MTTQIDTVVDPVHARAVKRRLNIATVVVTFGALAFGYDTGVISGALPYMTLSAAEGGLNLTPLTEGLVTSSLLLGAAFGAIIGGRMSDRWGRKHNITMLAFVFFLGALGCALAPSVPIMIVCRMVLGFAVGGASATVPMFIGELAPAHLRGPLVSRNELMIVTGQLVAYTSNAIISFVSDGAQAWRLMLGLATLPAVALWIGVHFVPESPRWLVAKGRGDEALEVLRQLRTGDPTPERDEIVQVVEEADRAQQGVWTHLRIPWIKRITLIGIGFGIVIQLTGVNAIMYFAPTVLMSTGMGTQASLVATIANGVVSVVAVAVGVVVIGRSNRRTMLRIGMIGLVVSQVLLGLAFLLPDAPWRGYLILALMLSFLWFMQMFCGICFWLMMAEMFPLRVRGVAMGTAVFCQWISNGIVTLLFPILLDAIGMRTFFIFAVINFVVLLWEQRYLPETKGKSLEYLEEELASGSDGRDPGPLAVG
ncbi:MULTISPECIES: sugar porter family MFS transporter [unclassified Actinomyces]|uniref:sugar porter family MFS transporter n=1 Tax=unclassified Actinomyces TaxID=2609248 RepID=UPI002017857F|nr:MULTISPECIES: sugar porter family MFS transporter [unclassified Actinomyces]MCL3778314.1 sugar porter family MFS transporter [Actinomyces sp. AC-20-1]MCL3788776.1 sugar porter family MFS transporter [Actinomyces sp. 187325]MCL3791644.1 sugar porter family MFS transporter [Actinomyces sp. 186855]MCL3794307.1 sugar porter family MFS transporter [Actinomyces sp. 217892]